LLLALKQVRYDSEMDSSSQSRPKTIYDPASKKPFKVSRSKIEMFTKCARCFYLDRRMGVQQPPGYPFTLNTAVDALLKKEFDRYRDRGEPHPLMEKHGIKGAPLSHPKMDDWRNSLSQGVQFHHKKTNFLVTGGVDDIWASDEGEFIVVDYKATSKVGQVGIEEEWQESYKRQMAVYSWLLRMNGFPVHHTGYFVYCNGRTDRDGFDQRLEFDISVIPYRIEDAWVEPTLLQMYACLQPKVMPAASPSCSFCAYIAAARAAELFVDME
jgi:hypothetical protein